MQIGFNRGMAHMMARRESGVNKFVCACDGLSTLTSISNGKLETDRSVTQTSVPFEAPTDTGDTVHATDSFLNGFYLAFFRL